jgi:branched-chain amino acid transport system permease protein
MTRSTILRLGLLIMLALVPAVQSNQYWLHVFSIALIGVILALGLQLLLGMAGLLSLGQGAFYGIGAYAAALLASSFELPFLVSILAGGVVAAAASLLLVPIVRLKGSSFAVATLGFSIIVHLIILNEDWLTGGSIGLMDIPKPAMFGLNLASEFAFYYVCLIVAGIVYVGIDRLTASRFGRALMAMSQDEEAARASGIAVDRYKSKCVLVAAFTAGVAGALYAYHTRYLSPNDFTFQRSIDILIMVVVGGLGSLPGAALGAAIVVLAPEFLRSSGESRLILFGLLVVILVGVGNRGLIGLISALAHRLMALRRPAAAMRAQEP